MKLQKLNRALMGALLMSGALAVASQAHALNIDASTPTTLSTDGWFLNTNYWTTNQTTALDASDVKGLTGYTGDLTSIYKKDYPSAEEGMGATYYTTTFTLDSEMEPSGASIVWDGPLWIACPTCYLVVKDGAQGNPAAYVFDLLSWNGKETITLSGFWEGEGTPGAISYVEIWNTGGGSLVPEAETYAMMLAGLGLVGFAVRRKRGKTA